MRTRLSRVLPPLLAVTAFLLLPSHASAQNAEIAGVVRDSSGAVLPGVTVEASSPALIEKTRVVYTDGQGAYRVIALVPGTYRVTYTLPGFGTVAREGIVLTAAFTASVDVAMSVGAVAETVTVSGQSPLVDIQATTQRRALTSELINDLPTGRSFQNLAVLVPGVQMPLIYQDVGGADGARWQTLKVHGSRDDQMPLLMNGMPFNNMNNSGGGYNHTLAVNTGTVQEMTITTSGSTAETKVSGVVSNTVVKEGSNRFNYYFYTDFTNDSLQSDNLSQELRSRGLQSVNHVNTIFELNPTLGGPIVKDRLWFYGGFRYLESTKYLANIFLTKDPLAPLYCNQPAGCLYGYGTIPGLEFLGGSKLVPDSRDLGRPDVSGDTFHRTYTANLTWQISKKNKANFFYHIGQRNLINDANLFGSTPESTAYLYSAPDYLAQAHWTNPLTSKLLLEGGFNFFNETWWWWQRPGFGLSVANGPEVPQPRYELAVPTYYGTQAYNVRAFNHQYNMRFAANYVTGSHAFKFGMQDMWGTRNFRYEQNNSQVWYFLNGAPVGVLQSAYPLEDHQHLNAALGLYAQDRWTIKNVTLNLGVRFDYHNAKVPAQDIPALPFVPAKHYDALLDTPSWKDLSPRLGFAWDTRGNGKTVARFNYGHYLASESVATATANNPVNTRVNYGFRTWLDFNGDLKPNCDLTLQGANGECFGLDRPLGNPDIVTRWDPKVLRGWGVRPSDDEILVGLQQQLHDRLSMDVQWTRHSFGNLFATERRATPTGAFDSFCVSAPKDSRLPGGGGNQICGFADVKPAYFGVTPDNFVTSANNFGKITDLYTGFDLTLTARLAQGGQASGGFSTGRERTDYCSVADRVQIGSNTDYSVGKVFLDNYVGDNVNNTGRTASGYPSSLYCAVSPPFQPDWKGLVSYPLPWWGLHASATWQNRAGPQILASQVVAALNNTLGRAPTSAALSAPLIAPGTLYEDRLNQLDVRFAKSVKIGSRGRLQGTVSVFNVLNANSILQENYQYGASWLQPTLILQGRLVKFGAQLDF